MTRVVGLALCLLLAGCFACPFGHISTTDGGPPVGSVARAKNELVGMLVSFKGPDGPVLGLDVTQLPGFSGPEVLQRVYIHQGQEFVTVGTRSSAVCFQHYAILKPLTPLKYYDGEVWAKIYDSWLNPENFERVESK